MPDQIENESTEVVDDAQGSNPETPNWQGKYDGQLKVNRDLETKLKDAREKADKVDDLERQLAALQGREAEFAKAREDEEARRKVEADALAKANERILKAEIRAAAKGVLADPSDALRYLDLAGFEVDTDGSVDPSVVSSAIEALIADKPYLAAQGGKPAALVSPTADREGKQGGQLTREDLKSMSPDEIVKARDEGRLSDLVGN